MLGVAELVLSVLACLVFGAAGAALLASSMRKRKSSKAPTADRPPVDLMSTLLVAASIPVLAIAGFALGGAFLQSAVLGPLGGSGVSFAVTSPSGGLASQLRMGAVLASWWAAPSFSLLLWLVFSSSRSLRRGLVLAATVFCMAGASGAIGLELVVPAVASLARPGVGMLLLDDAVGMVASGIFAFGLGAACLAAVWIVGSSSKRALRRVLLGSVIMPPVSLIVAALLTPPDVVSQILVAFLLGVFWIAGLGLAALTRRVGRPPLASEHEVD